MCCGHELSKSDSTNFSLEYFTGQNQVRGVSKEEVIFENATDIKAHLHRA